MSPVEAELEAITSYLCRHHRSSFVRLSSDTLETNARDAFLLASLVSDAFFLRRVDGKVEPYRVSLDTAFPTRWARDFASEYAELLEGKKVVKFFPHWESVGGTSSEDYRRRREDKMHRSLSTDVEKKMGKDLGDVLFVPYTWYSKGLQFGERIYHYIAGLILRDMGYLVCDEYVPSIMTDRASTPDISAFRTRELVEIMQALRVKGVISAGAFLQELQLCSLFPKWRPSPCLPPKDQTDAEVLAVEVKRSESRYLITKGSRQLQGYLSEAHGFYDEGYVAAPFVDGPGTISLDRSGEAIFKPPAAPLTSADVNDYWRERKVLQLHDVKASVILHLVKNYSLQGMLNISGISEGAETYEVLLGALREVDVEDVISSLECGRG